MTNEIDESIPAGAEAGFSEERRESLARALQERFDMAPEDAAEVASVLADVFGAQTEVNDETLDPSTRSIFYTLEAKKLLSFRREEYSIESGERRRGFWWRIRDEALQSVETLVPVEVEEDVYANLPRDAWARQHA